MFAFRREDVVLSTMEIFSPQTNLIYECCYPNTMEQFWGSSIDTSIELLSMDSPDSISKVSLRFTNLYNRFNEK